jgi:hypothetical protein
MNPTRDTHTTLVDLLDRILDKGMIIDADLIIQVAGIPLIGVKLKAAIAGIETMLKYGIWEDWDAAQRALATEDQRKKEGKEIKVNER